MRNLTVMPTLPKAHGFKKGDVFLLFGELFSRGYANGLVDQAKAAGMTILGVTVGRRDKDNKLRPLNAEELAAAEENLGGKILNYPHWAGFDMDPTPAGVTVSDLIANIKPNEWQDFTLDWAQVEEARAQSYKRFRNTVDQMVKELETLVPRGANLFFAHTMAGGIPKAKIFLVLLNRAVKGMGARYAPSKELWESDLGRLAARNYDAVTADTFLELIEATQGLRQKVEGWGGVCSYSAYGYHGTPILIQDRYLWQTYTPYLPGWAKMRLEDHAIAAWEKGIKAVVYNCPEIRTNSSDLFNGVELSLYPLIRALRHEGGGPWAEAQAQACQDLMIEGMGLEAMLEEVDAYHLNPIITPFHANFQEWPKHNSQAMADLMLATSDKVMEMNRDKKNLITDYLSALVVESSGRIMLDEGYAPRGPVVWLGHDMIAKDLLATHS